MANTERARRLRHAHETNALTYGHFGTPTYDNETHTWSFLRQHRIPPRDEGASSKVNSTGFQLLHERITELSSGPTLPPLDIDDSYHQSRKTALLKQLPDVALLSKYLPTTHFTVDAERSVPVPGILLAFGSATVSSQLRQRQNDPPTRPIAVLAAGRCDEKLQLVEFGPQDITLQNSIVHDEKCSLPCVLASTSTSWSNSAERIRHVSFAGISSRRFLVVRASGTSILAPIIARSGLAAQNSDGVASANQSFVDPSLVLTIPSSRTGEGSHAHAALNPTNPSLVAIVDINGQWSIWRILGRSGWTSRILYHALLKGSNDLASHSGATLSRNDPSNLDDWHRICWLRDSEKSSERVLVCNRRLAVVFDQRGNIDGQVDVRLGPLSDGNQILDIRNSESQPFLIFFLTTSRLLVFSSQEISEKGRVGYEPLRLVCSWNHFRGRSDLKLRMSTLELAHDIFILLYSSHSHIAVLYRFGHEILGLDAVSLHDPSMFNMPPELQKRMNSMIDLALYAVDFVVDDNPPDEANFGLMKMVARTTDGTVLEAVYKHPFTKSRRATKGFGLVPRLRLPNISARPVLSTTLVDDSDDSSTDALGGVNEIDDFVVADRTEEQESHSIENRNSQTTSSLSEYHPHLRNWQRLLDYDRFRLAEYQAPSLGISLETALRRFRALQLRDDPGPMQLVAQLVSEHQITDVEQESEAVMALLGAIQQRADLAIQSAGLGEEIPALSAGQTLLQLYELASHSYVQSFGENMTDRNRVNRERLVRQVAGEVFLGDLIIRSSKNPDIPTSPNPNIPKESGTGLPSSPPEAQPDASQAVSSQPSTSQSLAVEEEPAVSRLRSYAAFRERVPPLRLSHQASTSNILAHLADNIDEDPAEYSYRGTNDRLKLVEQEVAAQSLDPRERRKATRQAARLQKRLEKTAKIGQEVMMQQRVLPSVASLGRGIGLPGREIQSSQVAVPDSSQGLGQSQVIPGLTMTQPERGAFGTRPMKTKAKDKGTKRRAGF
ncbi:hypothetical protein LTR72_006156 [Exophiala xenobiotica]|nr:hypothetical protein LTR72_006156 [Exophiala xenobiotica]KAK5294936.1 hypothetical protein LTR14_004105 [Exophiala xenobiotica]KAK5327621.1 hypothetical protein LTR93_003006 [Exophiala xenobiotica]KAK5483025.1 hypothetical protein LTR55_006424 [Exophiala xenobiotica]